MGFLQRPRKRTAAQANCSGIVMKRAPTARASFFCSLKERRSEMIVQRLNFHVKSGKGEKAIELIKEAKTIVAPPRGAQVLNSNIGPFNKIIYDLKFENFTELEAFWEKWWSLPETPGFMDRWNELVADGGGSEIWTVVD
jgi:hypothetical protein